MSELTKARKSELCLRCMKCCNITVIPTCYTGGQRSCELLLVREFYTTKGFKTFVYERRLYVVINAPCKKLTKNGCSIYKNRPFSCKQYDGRLDPYLKKECLWTKEEENNAKREGH